MLTTGQLGKRLRSLAAVELLPDYLVLNTASFFTTYGLWGAYKASRLRLMSKAAPIALH
jgi:hypothetical protein